MLVFCWSERRLARNLVIGKLFEEGFIVELQRVLSIDNSEGKILDLPLDYAVGGELFTRSAVAFYKSDSRIMPDTSVALAALAYLPLGCRRSDCDHEYKSH